MVRDLGERCVRLAECFDHLLIDQGAVRRTAGLLAMEPLETPPWDHSAFPRLAGSHLDAVIWLGNALNFCYWVPPGERMWGIEIEGRREVDAFALFGLLSRALDEGVDLLDGEVLKSDEFVTLFHRGDGTLQLVDRRVRILAEIGESLLKTFGGRLENALAAMGTDALECADFLATWFPSFRDICIYQGHSVPLSKRAQLAAGMMHGARVARNAEGFATLHGVTIYADYMLPVTLRHLGVLRYSNHLSSLVDHRRVMESGCPEESEIRIGTVAAGEMILREARDLGAEIDALKLDFWLWRKGFSLEGEQPHHRVVTTNY
jgi:hypothetical protein